MRSIHAIILPTVLAAVVGIGTGTPALAKHKPTCDEIIAVYEEGGGQLSAEELAKKMSVPIKRVRECMRTKHANPSDTPPAPGQPQK